MQVFLIDLLGKEIVSRAPGAGCREKSVFLELIDFETDYKWDNYSSKCGDHTEKQSGWFLGSQGASNGSVCKREGIVTPGPDGQGGKLCSRKDHSI